MGVGFGFAIAAQNVFPDHKIVMVEGDSAFGFSAMELETAARYKMPLKCIIINNSGIMLGASELDSSGDLGKNLFPAYLLPGAKYELMA
jgi:2-hydroxyacyl-CoA lyase 1